MKFPNLYIIFDISHAVKMSQLTNQWISLDSLFKGISIFVT